MGDWTMATWDNFADADDGTLNEWCLEFTVSDMDPVMCGDDTAHYGEACDGADLNGNSCAAIDGFVGGELGCMADCSDFDTTNCAAPGCGNDILEAATETCDGTDLGGAVCDDFEGFTGEGLACAADCGSFDTSGCEVVECGDGIVNGPEECDGDDLNMVTCDDIDGFTGAGLACADDCTLDTSACEIDACGDGVLDDGEECDGTTIGGATCEGAGFTGGVVACAADCTVDTSSCSNEVLAYCSEPGTVIPTDADVTVTDTLDVPDSAIAADVDVFVDITHTWVADISVTVEHPLGPTAELFPTGTCGNDDDVFAFFDDASTDVTDCNAAQGPAIEGWLAPSTPLDAFNGADIMGTWTLSIFDDVGGDGGAINQWCVYVTPEAP